jgi:hypothetical protein
MACYMHAILHLHEPLNFHQAGNYGVFLKLSSQPLPQSSYRITRTS